MAKKKETKPAKEKKPTKETKKKVVKKKEKKSEFDKMLTNLLKVPNPNKDKYKK